MAEDSNSPGDYQRPRFGDKYEFRGIVYHGAFPDVHKLLEFEDYRSNDIILASYPKSGTTWMQEIIYGLLHDIDNVGGPDINERFPFIEASGFPGIRQPLDVLAEMTSPRLIKTHMRREFFEHAFRKNAKFIVLVRNPKDVIVSYYHFYKLRKAFQFHGDFNEFFELFKQRRLVHGDWFDWVLDWWQERENPNVHFVTYEDLKADVRCEVRKLAAFLRKDVSDEHVEKVVEAASFDSLKSKRAGQPGGQGRPGCSIFRKGIVGDWVTSFTDEQRRYVDDIYDNRIRLAGVDLQFDSYL